MAQKSQSMSVSRRHAFEHRARDGIRVKHIEVEDVRVNPQNEVIVKFELDIRTGDVTVHEAEIDDFREIVREGEFRRVFPPDEA